MEEKMRALIDSLMTKQEEVISAEEYEAFAFAIDELQKILSESRECKDCGAYYEITDREVAFYKKNNLFLPKRCPDCREARKAKKTFVAETASAL